MEASYIRTMNHSVFPEHENDFVDLEPVNGLGPASQQRNTDSRLLKARHPNPNASQGSFSNGEFTDDENETEDGQSQPKYGKKTRGRVKIKMQFIGDKLRRYTTFSKRKTGIMKKVRNVFYYNESCYLHTTYARFSEITHYDESPSSYESLCAGYLPIGDK